MKIMLWELFNCQKAREIHMKNKSELAVVYEVLD
jgi:hypothetical protein